MCFLNSLKTGSVRRSFTSDPDCLSIFQCPLCKDIGSNSVTNGENHQVLEKSQKKKPTCQPSLVVKAPVIFTRELLIWAFLFIFHSHKTGTIVKTKSRVGRISDPRNDHFDKHTSHSTNTRATAGQAGQSSTGKTQVVFLIKVKVDHDVTSNTLLSSDITKGVWCLPEGCPVLVTYLCFESPQGASDMNLRSEDPKSSRILQSLESLTEQRYPSAHVPQVFGRFCGKQSTVQSCSILEAKWVVGWMGPILGNICSIKDPLWIANQMSRMIHCRFSACPLPGPSLWIVLKAPYPASPSNSTKPVCLGLPRNHILALAFSGIPLPHCSSNSCISLTSFKCHHLNSSAFHLASTRSFCVL